MQKKVWGKPRRRQMFFQDPMQGAPMEVRQIPLAAKPKFRYGLDYLPGTGYVRIHGPATATPWRGGIFGQPPIPYGRQGIFKDHWALPPSMAYDDTGVFTPFKQRRIPGSCMDCGEELSSVLGQDPGPDLTTSAEGWVKTLSRWLFGPHADGDPRTTQQILRDNEKRAWIRAGLIVAAFVAYEEYEHLRERGAR